MFHQVADCQIGGAHQLGKHWSVVRHEWLQLGDGVNVAVVRKIKLVASCLTDCSTFEDPKYLHVSLWQGNRALGVGLQLEQDRIPHHEHALNTVVVSLALDAALTSEQLGAHELGLLLPIRVVDR